MNKAQQKAFNEWRDDYNICNTSTEYITYRLVESAFEAGLNYQKQDKIKIPPQQIVDLYHEILPDLPEVKKLTSARKCHIKARCQEDFIALLSWRKYFSFVRESKFLMGKVEPTNGHRKLKVDLDWLINESNAVKIIEGKYV